VSSELGGPAELLDWLVEKDERGEEGEQPLRGNAHRSGRPDEHRRHRQRGQHLGDGRNCGPSPGGAGERVRMGLGPGREARCLRGLHPVGLHRPHRGQRLPELPRHPSQPDLTLPGAPEHRAGEPRHRDARQRHHREGHQRQSPVQSDRYPRQHDDLQPVADPRAHRVDGGGLHCGHVGREARQEVPAHPVRQLHRGLAQEGVEQRPAEPGHRPLAELSRPGELGCIGHALHQRHPHQGQREREKQPLSTGALQLRDPSGHPAESRCATGEQEAERRTDQEGIQTGREREHRHRRTGEEEPSHVRARVRREPPERAPARPASRGIVDGGGHQGPEVYHPAPERPWRTAS